MAAWLDVAGRLDEGRPAVERTQSYAQACGAPKSICDGYGSEDGLDLYALDADCARLRSAGEVALGALRMERDQLASLTKAWTGPGADAAVEFVRRHCDAAAEVATEIRAAAQRCESLRDNLWHLVDMKAATAIAIDDRVLPQRASWLAAAATLATGAGDRAAAQEVVNHEVKPYVDNDIRNEWRSAMDSARAGVGAAYDMVIDRMDNAPRAPFEIPGDFGPASGQSHSIAADAPLAAGAPVLVHRPATMPSVSPAEPIEALSPAASPVPEPGGGSGISGGGGSSGGELAGGDLGGLGSLASRIVAELGDLFGADDPLDEDPDQLREPDEHEEQDEPEKSDESDNPEEPGAPKPTGQALSAAVPLAAESPPAESPLAVPAVAPIPDLPPVTATPGASTPCEIAADELPKAGQ